MPRMRVLWTCSVLLVILFTESHCVQKTTLTKNWGPQSMLYLKGKYGRRYIPDSDGDFYKSALKSLYVVIRDEVSASWKKIDAAFHGRESSDPLHRVGSFYTAETVHKL
ncbi:spexin prohormone 2 isoform X1 [Ictalurus punctatus]|uniref:Spexin prohormone 2 isoform X1 n=1 Tax=Ictalurus punctatus TaxID=7998 RepID=A0A979EZ47_ICTPU|nr:spexin prohormone 2 isoform X1 [Ictalurus punctatus]